MLDNAQKQHQEEVRPWVYVQFEFHHEIFVKLVIENKGRSPAYDLRVTLDKDFYQFAEPDESRNLRTFPSFNEPISWFPPGAKISVDMAQGFNFDVVREGKNLTPSRLIVSTVYADKIQSYSESCALDLTPYFHTTQPKSVSEQLGRIEEHLKRISNTLR